MRTDEKVQKIAEELMSLARELRNQSNAPFWDQKVYAALAGLGGRANQTALVRALVPELGWGRDRIIRHLHAMVESGKLRVARDGGQNNNVYYYR